MKKIANIFFPLICVSQCLFASSCYFKPDPKNNFFCIYGIEESKVGAYFYSSDEASKPSLLYSLDSGVTWLDFPISTDIDQIQTINVPKEGWIYIKGNNLSGFNSYYGDNDDCHYTKFVFSTNSKVGLSGNIMGLIDEGTDTCHTIPNQGCFYSLFGSLSIHGDSKDYAIRTINNNFLGSVVMQPYSYCNMFKNCNNLSIMPDLTSERPQPYCYAGMFQNCLELKETTDVALATLADSCLNDTFNGCSSLRKISVHFTEWTTDGAIATQNWVSGVPKEGNFICPAKLDHSIYGDSGIPQGWTVQNL